MSKEDYMDKNDNISRSVLNNKNGTIIETKLRTFNNYNFDNYDEILDYIDYKIIPKHINKISRKIR